MLNLQIEPAQSRLTGDPDTLKTIRESFSFRDKAAESELARFKKSMKWRERALVSASGSVPQSFINWKNERLAELKEAVHVYIFDLISEEELSVPTGMISSLISYLIEQKLIFEISDNRDFDISKRILSGEMPSALRKPQIEALEILTDPHRAVQEKGLGLIRLATGTGKTALAQELIRELGVPSIFLVPSVPILKQTVSRFERAFGKKNVKAYGDGKKQVGYVTVATYQSVNAAPEGTFDQVRLALADECHHVSADTFYDVMQNKLKNAVHRYGLTAFEERADGSTQLIEAAVGPVVYRYDAAQAIEDEYLARPVFVFYEVDETKGTFHRYKGTGKDRVISATKNCEEYDGDDHLLAYRNWVVGNDILNERVAGLTEAFVANGKSVLILVDEKEHGERLRALLSEAGFAVGGGKDNESLQREFNARRLKVLIGTSTIGEGADTIPVDVLINLQGGASKSQTLQAAGRALRNDPDEYGVPRKPHTLIIDFSFPNCRMLDRHSKTRERVYAELGDVYKNNLLIRQRINT